MFSTFLLENLTRMSESKGLSVFSFVPVASISRSQLNPHSTPKLLNVEQHVIETWFQQILRKCDSEMIIGWNKAKLCFQKLKLENVVIKLLPNIKSIPLIFKRYVLL